jgi:hypothetical protein
MVEVHGWKVVGGLADCHRQRASQDAAVKERGVWGQRAGCGEAVTGLWGARVAGGFGFAWVGRGGRVLQCMDEAEGSHFCYVFDPILLTYGVLVGVYMSCPKL